MSDSLPVLRVLESLAVNGTITINVAEGAQRAGQVRYQIQFTKVPRGTAAAHTAWSSGDTLQEALIGLIGFATR